MLPEAMNFLTRREFVSSVGGLVASCVLAGAQEISQRTAFLYGRSGKLYHLSANGVFLGGLVISYDDLHFLDEQLRQEALQSPLARPLRFSTSPDDARFLHAALNVLSGYSFLFIGVKIQAPHWAATPETFEYWRRKIESDALNVLTASGTTNIYSLKHDWDLDARVYSTLSSPETNPIRSFTLYPSETESSRAFQLSNVIAKCIANRDNLSVSGSSVAKNAEIFSVLSHFGLLADKHSNENSRIRLATLRIE